MTMEVTSEILPSFEHEKISSEHSSGTHVVSKIRLRLPSTKGDENQKKNVSKDADGDYILPRAFANIIIDIEHQVSTRLDLVGLQVWRGALLLADLVINMKEQLAGKTVLEIGSGVGLTGVIASMFAKHVICSDIDLGGILQLLKNNLKRNEKLIRAETTVACLDWFSLDWPNELENLIREASIILAADVIYDDRVTEAFIRTITKILSLGKKTLYVALEKRYVFTLAELDSVAPCYEHFLRCMRDQQTRSPWCHWSVSEIDVSFPQYLEYERIPQLVIWKITS